MGEGARAERSTPRHVVTPASTELLAARERGDAAAFHAVMDRCWLELWYAFDPVDLRRLVEEQQTPAVIGPSAALLYELTGAPVGSARVARRRPQAEGDASTRVNVAAHDAGQLRLRGRARAALELLQEAEGDLRQLSGGFVDASGGLVTVYGLNLGATALLAGDLVTARAALLRSAGPMRPARFPFALRDVAAKAALTHAVAGDMGEARHWLESARTHERTHSWVESLVDDTLWLVDYMVAVDSLDLGRAEQLRLEKPSPLAHLEWWGIALQTQVRHLTLVGRRSSAVQVCDAVAAAGLPLPGADGWQATVLAEARVLSRATGDPVPPQVRGTPLAALAHRVDAFAKGRFDAVVRPVEAEQPSAERDVRPALGLRMLRADALLEVGRAAEARLLLVETLEEVFERGVLSLLGFLTPKGLALVAHDAVGARAAAVLADSPLPQVDVVSPGVAARLTAAEVAVLQLLAAGRSRAEMATELCLSINTVKSQLATAYRKLGVRTREEAVVKVRHLGL